MAQHLTIELPDDAYEMLKKVAEQAGMTPEEWALRRLRPMTLTREERAAALARLLDYAGKLDGPSNLDNQIVDTDLANEYEATHEDDS